MQGLPFFVFVYFFDIMVRNANGFEHSDFQSLVPKRAEWVRSPHGLQMRGWVSGPNPSVLSRMFADSNSAPRTHTLFAIALTCFQFRPNFALMSITSLGAG